MDISSFSGPPLYDHGSTSTNTRAMIPKGSTKHDRIDRYELLRRLSGDSLLADACRSIPPCMSRPRRRGASTSICLPDNVGRWVQVPQVCSQTPAKTNREDMSEETMVNEEDEISGNLPSPEQSSSFSSRSETHRCASSTTLPTSSRHPTRLLPPRNGHITKPSAKLNQLRHKARVEALRETLLQFHGIDQHQLPIRRRLSTPTLALARSTRCRLLRRHSTSAYQSSPSSQHPHTPSYYRISPILGLITLPSPGSPYAFCLAAITTLDKTQDTLTDTWSRCCTARLYLPAIHPLWPALFDLSFAVRLLPDLNAPICHHHFLQPVVKSQHKTQRTILLKDDHAEHSLTATQLIALARACYTASDALWPLIRSLTAFIPAQRAQVLAKYDGIYRPSLQRRTERCAAACVRIVVQGPLLAGLRSARVEVCEALGLDADEVPGGQEDGGEVVMSGALEGEDGGGGENNEGEKGLEDLGGNVGGGKVPRRLRLRCAALQARYHTICFIVPSKLLSFETLEKMAAHTTQLLQQLKEASAGDAALYTELRDLRRDTMERLAKRQQTIPETIGLLDSVTRKMARPHTPLCKRVVRGVGDGWAKFNRTHFLQDLDQLFWAWDHPSKEAESSGEEMSWEEASLSEKGPMEQ